MNKSFGLQYRVRLAKKEIMDNDNELMMVSLPLDLMTPET